MARYTERERDRGDRQEAGSSTVAIVKYAQESSGATHRSVVAVVLMQVIPQALLLATAADRENVVEHLFIHVPASELVRGKHI